MRSGLGLPVQVLCDFDGTVTEKNVMEFIAIRFAGSGDKYSQAWDRGELTTPDEFRLTFATITASLHEMEVALDEVAFDESIAQLVHACNQRGYEFAILSDGLGWYIEYILARAGVGDVFLYANTVWEREGKFEFEFPWHSDETPRLATCKPAIVRSIKEQGKGIIYIGDGPSDFDAVKYADVIYAKPKLAAYCREHGHAYQPFSTFSDIIAHWQG
jgi:2-hydroxy-3-keto-5-methylthiopentenyl-1-phosphate phosphatase